MIWKDSFKTYYLFNLFLPRRHEGTKTQRGTKDRKVKKYKPLSVEEEMVGKIIVNAAYKVHTNLGPGLLEKVYEIALAYELEKA